jgi:hypothetical protein
MSKCSEQEFQKAVSDEEAVRGQLQAELAANKRHCRKLLSEARAAQYSALPAHKKSSVVYFDSPCASCKN